MLAEPLKVSHLESALAYTEANHKPASMVDLLLPDNSEFLAERFASMQARFCLSTCIFFACDAMISRPKALLTPVWEKHKSQE